MEKDYLDNIQSKIDEIRNGKDVDNNLETIISETKKYQEHLKNVKKNDIKNKKARHRKAIKLNVIRKLKHLKRKIRKKVASKKNTIIKISKSNCDLLKQKLSFEKNITRAKKVSQDLRIAGLNVENKVLDKTIKAKEKAKEIKENIKDNIDYTKEYVSEKASNVKDSLKKGYINVSTEIGGRALYAYDKLDDKRVLLTSKIKPKVTTVKNYMTIAAPSQVRAIKDIIKNKFKKSLNKAENYAKTKIANTKDYVSQKASSAKEKIRKGYINVSTEIGGRALYAYDKLDDKKYLLTSKIKPKVTTVKNYMTIAAPAQVRAIKDIIKNKFNKLKGKISNSLNVTDDQIAKRQQEIDRLRNLRSEYLEQLGFENSSKKGRTL